ncbi:lysM domain receptor-like kinase 3 [Aristolochia californica]|uniref:lysM domain receptor-like kinase 3 n=1 Tax=Aristolochia californica TaxID=171875 RepID=UPI0035E003DB
MRASTRGIRHWLALAVILVSFLGAAKSKCNRGCELALASFYVVQGQTLDNISRLFSISSDVIYSYNTKKLPSKDILASDIRINIPFPSCECINGDFLGHTFRYNTKSGDTYYKIASQLYSNLTTADWLQQVNTYNPINIPLDREVNVTINCSCGKASVSSDYGMFVTYPLRSGENLSSVTAELEFTDTGFVERYNQDVNFTGGQGLVFVPAKDLTGSYRPLKSRTGPSVIILSFVNMSKWDNLFEFH